MNPTIHEVRQAQAGDPAGREALARRWLPVVHGAALAWTRDAAQAEDLAQEAFLKAFSRLDRLKDPARIGPWLLQIARNALRDGIRRRRARPADALLDEPAAEAPSREPGESPVIAAWRQLPETERLVFWLRSMQGISFREIAELLDRSKSAVDRSYRRALARLREELSHVPLS